MKSLRWLSTMALTLALFSVVVCHAAEKGSTVTNSPTRDRAVLRSVLPNGMIVILREDHRAPVAALHVWVKTGSVYEAEYAGTGISHFVEHMLFKGTQKRKVGQIAQEIQSYGGEINAHTSHENTVYTINIESGQFFKALDILADALMHSAFDAEECKKERDVILKEINMNEDDPERYLSKLFWSTLYAEHPAKDPVIGYEELFRNVSREDLLRYFKTRYVPNNMVLVAAGDFSAQETLQEVTRLFGDFPRGIWSTPLLPPEPKQLGPRRIVVTRELGQAYCLLGFPGPALSDPDMAVMDVLSIIVGEGKSSRLYQEARQKKALVSAIGTWSHTPSFPGVFGVWASLDPEKCDPVLDLVWRELERLKTEPVSAAELEKAKAQTLHDYYFSLETAAGQASDLGSNEVMAHNVSFSQEYIRRVGEVSAQDIQRAARTYFRDDRKNEIFLMPKGSEAKMLAPAATAQKEPPISSHVLKNGVRLLIREDHRIPTASMRVLFKGGLLREDTHNNGLSNLFAETLIQGTRHHTASQIVEELEKAGGTLSAFSGNNSMGFSVDVLAQNWSQAVALVGEILTEPDFAAQEVEKEKQAVLLQIQSLEDQIFQTASKLFRAAMFEGHPYQFVSLGSKESVEKLTREDLLAYYQQVAVGPNIVITVYGDVQADKVVAALEQKTGVLPNGAAPYRASAAAVRTEPKKAVKNQAGKQAIVLLGYPSVTLLDKDRYVLEVMEALFSGQASRLFGAIRESHGLAYMVGCFQIIGVDPGAFVFYVGTVPDGVDFVVETMLAQIAKMQETGVDSQELERAKRGLIGERKIHLQTNAQLAYQTGMDELYGLGWDDYTKYYDRIRAVCAEDILRVSRQYFKTNRSVLAIVQPPSKGSEEWKKKTQK